MRGGAFLGYVATSFSPEQIADAKRRLKSDEPCYTTQEMLAHLRSLAPEDG